MNSGIWGQFTQGLNKAKDFAKDVLAEDEEDDDFEPITNPDITSVSVKKYNHRVGEIKALNSKLADAKAQIGSLKEDTMSLESEKSKLHKEIEKSQDRYTSELDTLQGTLEEKLSEKVMMEDSLKSEQQRTSQLKEKLREAVSQIEQLREEMQGSQLTTLSAHAHSSGNQLEGFENVFSGLVHILDGKLREDLGEKGDEESEESIVLNFIDQEELEKYLKEKPQVGDSKLAENYKKLNESLVAKVKELNKSQSNLNATIKELEDRISDITERNEEVDRQIATKETQNHTLKEQVASLENELKETVSTQKDKIHSVEEQNHKLRSTLTDQQHLFDEVSREKNETFTKLIVLLKHLIEEECPDISDKDNVLDQLKTAETKFTNDDFTELDFELTSLAFSQQCVILKRHEQFVLDIKEIVEVREKELNIDLDPVDETETSELRDIVKGWISKLLQECIDLKEEMSLRQHQRNELETEVDSLRRNNTLNRQADNQRQDSLLKQISSLQQNCKEYLRREEEARNKFEKSQQDYEMLMVEKAQLEMEQINSNNKISELQNKVQEYTLGSLRAEEKQQASDKECGSLKEKIETLEKEIEELRKHVSELEAVEDHVKTLQASNEELEKMIHDKDQEIENGLKAQDNIRKVLEELQVNLDWANTRAEEQINKLQEQLFEAKEEIQKGKEKEQDFTEREKEIQGMEDRHELNLLQIDQLEKEKEEIQEDARKLLLKVKKNIEDNENLIDRRIISRFLINYISKEEQPILKKQMLESMAGILNFSAEEREYVGLGTSGSRAETPNPIGNGLGDEFINFLLKSSSHEDIDK